MRVHGRRRLRQIHREARGEDVEERRLRELPDPLQERRVDGEDEVERRGLAPGREAGDDGGSTVHLLRGGELRVEAEGRGGDARVDALRRARLGEDRLCDPHVAPPEEVRDEREEGAEERRADGEGERVLVDPAVLVVDTEDGDEGGEEGGAGAAGAGGAVGDAEVAAVGGPVRGHGEREPEEDERQELQLPSGREEVVGGCEGGPQHQAAQG